jgi:putative ABC transport system permease protein
MPQEDGSYGPPVWALKFLHWYCNEQLIEEIEGDLFELFDRKVTEGKVYRARWLFWWNVLRFFRLSNLKNKVKIRSNSTIMFRNYIKIGFRSMTKNWSTSFINIFGLSLAIGCFITIFIFIDLQLSMDGFHARKNDIYQVIMKVDTDNGIEQWGDSPYPLSKMIAQDVSGVEGFFRIEFQYANVRYEKNVFREFMVFADPGYLKYLDFKVAKGDPNTLLSVDKMVLAHHTAIKYFGNDDPIGKQLKLKFEGGKTKTFQVGAVLEKYPNNNSFGYDFLLPLNQFEQMGLSESSDWEYLTDANFIVLEDKTDPTQVLSFLDPYVDAYNQSSEGTTAVGFRLIPLSKLSVTGHEIIGSIANFSNPAARVSLMVIVILLTLLASFNYMNISVASAAKRLKEIGIRKVMGSYKRQIIHQFLTENFLQVIFAMILGTFLCYFLMLPGFNSLIPIDIPFSFSSIGSMVGLFAGLLIFIGLVSGAYPSLYISRFMPIHIFRGSQRFGDSSLFSKVLLSFQLIIAFLTIVGCFMFTDNAIHQRDLDWGYEKQGLISIRANSTEEFEQLRNEVANLASVVEITSGKHHSGRGYGGDIASQQEKEIRTDLMKVAPDYPEKMGMKLDDGRFFNQSLDRSNNREALIDPLFVKRMGWEDAVGQNVKVEGDEYEIVGVLSPFVIEQWHAYGDKTPIMVVINPEEEDRYLVVKTSTQDLYEFNDELEKTWKQIVPNDPYTGEIQANVFDDFYRETKANVTIIVFISIVSTILACLGLFGLLSFNIQKRLKELSVRKVLGATRMSIVHLIAKKYGWVVLISFVVGGTGGYMLMIQMINGIYAEPKNSFGLPVILAIVIMTLTIAATLTGQILRATRVNPSVNLRSE